MKRRKAACHHCAVIDETTQPNNAPAENTIPPGGFRGHRKTPQAANDEFHDSARTVLEDSSENLKQSNTRAAIVCHHQKQKIQQTLPSKQKEILHNSPPEPT